jgi:drug/metabolite transporter (DMT)-like permease
MVFQKINFRPKNSKKRRVLVSGLFITFARRFKIMNNFIKSTTFLAILATWFWSTAFAVVKIGLEYQTPLQFAGLRFIIAGSFVFLAFGKAELFFSELRKHWRFVFLIGFMQIICQYGFFYLGMNLIPSALGALLVGASPLFIAMVAHFTMKTDRLTPLKTTSILIGVIGIVIITVGRQKVEIKGNLEWLGIILLLINNVLSGYSNVLISKSDKKMHPVVLSASSMFLGGLMLYLLSIPLEGVAKGPFPLSYYLSLGWLGFLSAAAITIWYTLLSRPGVKVSELNTWKFLIPVSGAWLSWFLIPEEKPDLMQLVAMAVIALSLVILNQANRRLIKKEVRK